MKDQQTLARIFHKSATNLLAAPALKGLQRFCEKYSLSLAAQTRLPTPLGFFCSSQ